MKARNNITLVSQILQLQSEAIELRAEIDKLEGTASWYAGDVLRYFDKLEVCEDDKEAADIRRRISDATRRRDRFVVRIGEHKQALKNLRVKIARREARVRTCPACPVHVPVRALVRRAAWGDVETPLAIAA